MVSNVSVDVRDENLRNESCVFPFKGRRRPSFIWVSSGGSDDGAAGLCVPFRYGARPRTIFSSGCARRDVHISMMTFYAVARSFSTIRNFASANDAQTWGLEILGLPFDVHSSTGAVVWVWEQR
jgi:hypothetical protein